MHEALSKLLRYAARHSAAVSFTSNTTAAPHLFAARRHDESTAWVPSSGQLSAAIYALCCSFAYSSPENKRLLANSGDSRAVMLETGGGGNTLHHLVNHGLSAPTHPPVRWLCLTMTSSLVAATGQVGNTASLRNTLAAVVAAALQKMSRSASQDLPEAAAFMLNCLTALVSGGPDGARTAANPGGFYSLAGVVTAVSGEKLEPLPTLLEGLADETTCRYSHRADVQLALCRCLGVVNGGDAAGSEKRGASLQSDQLLRLLCEALSHPNGVVAGTAAVSLCHVMHCSEKARGFAQRTLRDDPTLARESVLDGATNAIDRSVNKARMIIRALQNT